MLFLVEENILFIDFYYSLFLKFDALLIEFGVDSIIIGVNKILVYIAQRFKYN